MDVNIHICIFIVPFTLGRLYAFRRVYQVLNLIFVHGYYPGFYGVQPFNGVRAHHCFHVSHRLRCHNNNTSSSNLTGLVRSLLDLRGSATISTKVSTTHVEAFTSITIANPETTFGAQTSEQLPTLRYFDMITKIL